MMRDAWGSRKCEGKGPRDKSPRAICPGKGNVRPPTLFPRLRLRNDKECIAADLSGLIGASTSLRLRLKMH